MNWSGLKKTLWITASAAVCFLLLSITACKKATASSSHAVIQSRPAFSVEELKQQRLSWNLKTLVEPYEQAGFTNSKWDASARLAMTEYARARANTLSQNEPWAQSISTNAYAAIQSGCKDPMVTYLYIKYAMGQTNSKEAFTKAYCATADAMNSSSYPPIRNFYASLRAEQQYMYTYGYGQQC